MRRDLSPENFSKKEVVGRAPSCPASGLAVCASGRGFRKVHPLLGSHRLQQAGLCAERPFRR